jgi:hypothetical protein
LTFLSTLKKAASSAADILTTKGDLLSRSSSALGRLAVSTNNFSLYCDSAQTLGIKWAASATSTLTAAGDLLYASGANTLARLPKGTDNQVLKMNGSSLNWETLSGGGGATLNKRSAATSGAQTTTSTSLVDVTSLTTSITDNTGKFYATYSLNGYMSGVSVNALFCFDDGGTSSEFAQIDAARDTQITDSYVGDNDGQTLKVQVKVDGGTVTIDSTNVTGRNGHIEVLEIS